MSQPTLLLIGPRRSRQGLGEFVAAFMQKHGIAVTGILGRDLESSRAAAKHFQAELGIKDCQAWGSISDALNSDLYSACAICSPAESHLGYLEDLLAKRLHVFCEKPFVVGPDAPQKAFNLAKGFFDNDCHLMINTQWPQTLEAFRELHPQALAQGVNDFQMELSPESHGPEMLRECLPHCLSMLEALVGDGRIVDHDAESLSTQHLIFKFKWVNNRYDVRVKLTLKESHGRPKHARYVINGHSALRQIDLEDYSMEFGDEDRIVPVPDPMEQQIQSFCEALLKDQPVVDLSERLRNRAIALQLLSGALGS